MDGVSGVIEPATDRARRVAALAQRLRLLHAEMAEQPLELRADQLQDEVQRSLASMQPGDREGFLAELMEAFPAWGGNGSAAVAIPSRATKAAPAETPPDASRLTDMLIEAAAKLPEGERAKIKERLKAGGLADEARASGISVAMAGAVTSGAGVLSGAVLAELKRAAGLKADDQVVIDSTRAAEVAAVLSDFVLRLEPWACSYWQSLAPDAKNIVPPSLQKELQKFLAGDASVTKEVLAKNVYRLRSLVSLLMREVLEAGKQFGRDHIQRYAPAEIEKMVPAGGVWAAARAGRCWEQYVRLMEGVDAAGIEKRLRTMIAKSVDDGLGQLFGKK